MPGGSFDIWAWSPRRAGTWCRARVPATDGQTAYSYDWTVPANQLLDGSYKVRVWYRDAGGNGILADDSDATFAMGAFPHRDGPQRRRELGLCLAAQRHLEPLHGRLYGAASTSGPRQHCGWYKLNASAHRRRPGKTSYSLPWRVEPTLGTYQVRVWYLDSGGAGT